MEFSEPLICGTLVARRQRFLAEVRLADGTLVTAHCPNTGSMSGCAAPGWPVALSRAANPRRRCPFTWELVHNGRGWICINTGRTNALVAEALAAGRIPALAGYGEVRREPVCGVRSRLDFLLRRLGQDCFVEVKSVTLVGADGCNCFPDAVTERGRRHLGELEALAAAGNRAVMLFVLQRADGHGFRVAAEIDPAYATALEAAKANGVEVLVCATAVTLEGIRITGPA